MAEPVQARADLLELTLPVLTALSNAGLVKRAQRELEQDRYGAPEIESDGTVRVVGAEAVTVVFPPASGLAGSCSCGASGVCRHLLAAVLRYQKSVAESPVVVGVDVAVDVGVGVDAVTGADTDEGTDGLPVIDDDSLAAVLAKRTLTAATAAKRKGYLATVRRADDDDEAPCVVELGTVSVRFLLGSDLRYARCDCTVRVNCLHIALAAWAVGEARGTGSTAEAVIVGVGGRSAEVDPARGAVGADPNIDAAEALIALIAWVLEEGFAHLGPTLAYRLGHVTRVVERASWTWPALLLRQLGEQQTLLERRGAGDARAAVTEIVAGLMARIRAAATATAATATADTGAAVGGRVKSSPLPLPSAIVLGTSEKTETRLAQTRLVGAGASVSGSGDDGCSVEIVLVDPTSSSLLVTRRSFVAKEGSAGATGKALDGPAVATRRVVKGVTVQTLASGMLTTTGAARGPDRVVELRSSALRQSAVVAGSATIDRFESLGLVHEPEQIVDAWRSRPPRLLRPLLATEDIAVMSIATVEHTRFDPAEQCVELTVTTPGGGGAFVRCVYTDATPGAPAALARFAADLESLPQGQGFVVGRVTVRDGYVAIRPTLLASDRLVVPDLVPFDDEGRAALAVLPMSRIGNTEGPLEAVLQAAAAAVADLAFDGRKNAARWGAGVGDVVSALRRTGLATLADRFDAMRSEVVGGTEGGGRGGAGSRTLASRWADAAIAMSLARESV